MTFVFCAIAGADNPYDFVRILCDAQHLAILCVVLLVYVAK